YATVSSLLLVDPYDNGIASRRPLVGAGWREYRGIDATQAVAKQPLNYAMARVAEREFALVGRGITIR
ncbi:MAG TPA: hypothetical protein VMV45_19385, partial [Casimicrobiaceae bacterium]|nr:hypothetical protein [Casimicrobiaceae bacterium]